MARRLRSLPAGGVYHVMNRASMGLELFSKDGDYLAFENVLGEGIERWPGVRAATRGRSYFRAIRQGVSNRSYGVVDVVGGRIDCSLRMLSCVFQGSSSTTVAAPIGVALPLADWRR